MRLEAGAQDLLQIRWESCKRPPNNLAVRASKYLVGLKHAARKRKQVLTHSLQDTQGWVDFKWNAESKGAGRLLFDAGSSRVFILERSGGKGSSIVAEAHRIFDSFDTHQELLPWSVLGFEIRLPKNIKLEKFKFLTGRLTLQFKGKGIAVTAERWALADKILEKHDLLEWARGLIGDGEAFFTPNSLSLLLKPKLPWQRVTEAYVRHDAEGNRLLVLKAQHRNRPPSLDWLP